jgi:hypothetical protein
MVRGIEGKLRAVDDMHCEAVADVVAGTRSPETLHIATWLKTIERADDVALRLSGGIRHAYYMTMVDGQVLVTRRKAGAARTYDRDSQYIESLFNQYDPHPVHASEVSALE